MCSNKQVFIGFFIVAFASLGLLGCVGGVSQRGGIIKLNKRNKSLDTSTQHEKSTFDNEAASVVTQKLCELSARAQDEPPRAAIFGTDGETNQHRIADGIKNAERLLPESKHLTIESLKDLAARFNIKSGELHTAEKYINAVDTIELDAYLGDTAEILEDEPTKIRIGASYARSLASDEATIMLLGHELTHVAAQNDNLQSLINRIARTTNQLAAVNATEDQAEDLACDFIAEQTTKKFIRSHNATQSTAERLARALDYDCFGGNFIGDYEHLSDNDTLRAVLALDPELSDLILENK